MNFLARNGKYQEFSGRCSMAFMVYIVNPNAPNTPIGVDNFESDSNDPRQIEILGLKKIFEHYTPKQLKGYSYRIEEFSGKRRKVFGSF